MTVMVMLQIKNTYKMNSMMPMTTTTTTTTTTTATTTAIT